MLGVQGNDGWMLSAVPIRAPWQLETKAVLDPASAFKFELYELSKDWTQYTDGYRVVRPGLVGDRMEGSGAHELTPVLPRQQ